MRQLTFLKIFMLSVVLIGFSACDSFLDVNENPNEPEFVDENLQLPAIQGYFSYRVIANDPVRVSSLWMQQLAWNGVPENHEDRYYYTEDGPNNFWGVYSYVTVMNNVKTLIEQAEENEMNAHAGIGKVILAWNMSLITDFFNEAPYSEAFEPTNTSPGYDSQEEIYDAIFGLLEDALDDFENPGAITPGSDDLIYGGNLNLWTELTHTLIARFNMRLSEAPGNSREARANAALDALANGLASNASDADFSYEASAGSENPWYQYAIDSKWDTRDQLSHHYVNLLKDLEDPRLPIQARQAGAVNTEGQVGGFSPEPFDPSMFAQDDSTYVGHQNGEFGIGTANVSSIGEFYSAANAPVTWIGYAEAKFIEAEATLFTSGAAAAQPVLQDAVRASMEKLGVDGADIDAYLLDMVDLTTLVDEDAAHEQIMTQKYIANFLNVEAYHDWRRTGYPDLAMAEEPYIEEIPRRFPYPNSEYQYNAANVEATEVPIGPSAMTHRVWWDTRN